jgi:hypothetical protein
MSRLLLILGLVVVSSPAGGQQPVTPADMIGAVMKVSVTNDRVMRRDGRQYPNRYQTDWTIDFVSEDTIRPTFIGTDYSPRRTTQTPLEGGRLVTLGRPNETPSRGGGHQVWIFDAGVLTFLRTYEGGGMKGTFAVTRSGAGFSCTASVSWPREVGVATIIMRSYVDNAMVEIVSAKQSASSCTISKAAYVLSSTSELIGREFTDYEIGGFDEKGIRHCRNCAVT